MKYTLDWEAVDIDGQNTLTSADGTQQIGVTISTPPNGAKHPDEWVVGFPPGDDDAIVGDPDTIRSSDVKKPTELNLEFDREVTQLQFELYDVDAGHNWDDKVTLIALDADGNETPVDLSDLTAIHKVSGENDGIPGVTIEGEGNDTPDVEGPGFPDSVTVSIPGPVKSLKVVHDNGDDVHISGTVGLSDLHFEVDGGPVRDGIVHGTEGDDLITAGTYVDVDGDEVDNEDALIPGDKPNDDRIFGKGGDDTIDGGEQDDTIEGGDGSDSIGGGDGNDLIYGGGPRTGPDEIIDDASFPAPAPDPDPNNDRDTLSGGAGDDTIFGGDDDDVISGGSGDDSLDGGIDDDSITGGSGNDTIFGGQGDDTINAGVQNADFRPDLGYPGLYESDEDPNDDRDFVDGGLGDDLITTGDDDDTIYGGAGDDTIDAGFDRDLVYGDDGDDLIVAGEGSDTVFGGAGNDTIYGGIGDPADILNVPDSADEPAPAPDLVPDNGRDLLDGGDGDDVIFGEDDDDTILGGAGDDFLDGGIDDDSIEGGAGNDTIIGGQGDDFLSGGDDADTFIVNAQDSANDTIEGGNGGFDIDRIDVSQLGTFGTDWTLENVTPDGDTGQFAGIDGDLVFLDGNGGETGRLSFTNIEIICFTPGTRIATPRGEVPVEQLTAGDRVLTRDNGVQEIAWYGQTGLNAADFRARPHLAPVLIRAGALGGGLPERDMLVSPQHRVLVSSEKAAFYFDEREVLVAARHLVNGTTIVQRPVPQTTYIHFMCARHEVVLSDGAWTESFQPGDFSLQGIDAGLRAEILELFPELATEEGLKDYAAARRTLKRHEAVLLTG